MQFEQLGPYRIERVVGRGGMGAVYAAIHASTNEPCAVKVLSGAIADDPHFRERFKSEVETLQTLRHPNIVRLLGYGEQDGRLFYAMELIDGKSLQDVLQNKRFQWREVVAISVQICSALKHAHDHGVIHRDLKPANLLVAPGGVVKLSDFGIAKLFGATQITADGGIIGTADYMSPEQAEGRPITNRTDLYSLGCVMYAMLAGKPPFGGRTIPEIMHCLKYSEPEPVRRLAPTSPLELETIISQLLAKEPNDRMANAMLVSKRLKAMEHGLLRQANDDEYQLADDEPASKAKATELPTSVRPTVDLSTSEMGSGELTLSAGEPLEQPEGDETIVTDVQLEPPQSGETQRHKIRETHFVTVDRPSRAKGKPRRSSASGDHPHSNWKSILGLALALLLVVAAIWFGLQPASANTLYRTISSVAIESDDVEVLLEVKPQMEEFLGRFPDDPRREEVAGWLGDYIAHRLWRRLERTARKQGGLQMLSDIQQAYVEAFRAAKLDPGRARGLFLSLQKAELDPEHEEDDRQCMVSARHCSKRVAPEL